MKHIKGFRVFENTQELTQEQVDFLNDYTKGTWRVNPNTGLVDIKGNFDCASRELDSFKGVKFGLVSGYFDCSYNSLTSLEGSPKEVGGDFYCYYNSLTSLEGAPQEVGESFNCNGNSLTSLEGAPREVGGDFYCSDNSLTSLEGAPQEVGESFNCNRNSLTSLEGAPQKVGGNFRGLFNNSLTSLKGAPQKVGGYFECDVFKLEKNEWNLQGWLEILREGKEAKKLISTLPQFPEELNKEIKKDPSKWAYELKDIWNSEYFRSIRDKLDVPKDFIEDAGLYGDLTSIGLDI